MKKMSYSRTTMKANTVAVGGFTLIELLVAIVIIGLLSAIALPSYLNQAAKARSSESKSTLGIINRSQQAYYLERSAFASALNLLDAKIIGKFYSYAIDSVSQASANATTTPKQDGLKIHSAEIIQNADTFLSIICESNNTQAVGTTSTPPTSTSLCSSGYSQIQ